MHRKSDSGFSRFTFWIWVSSKARSNVPAAEVRERPVFGREQGVEVICSRRFEEGGHRKSHCTGELKGKSVVGVQLKGAGLMGLRTMEAQLVCCYSCRAGWVQSR